MKEMSPGRTALGVGLVAAIAALFMLFVGFGTQSLVDTSGDPYQYASLARRMLTDGFAAHGLTKREASLYPALIAAVYAITDEAPRVVKLLQCVMFAATSMIVFAIARRLYNVRTAVIAGLLYALNPLPLRYVADLHMETMVTLALMLCVWTMVRFADRPTVGRGLIVGAAAGVAALTKAIAIVPPLTFGAYLVGRRLVSYLRGTSPPAPTGPLAAIVVATLAVIIPWTVRNYQVTGGHFVLIAPGLSDAFLRGFVFSRSEYALLRRPPYADAENECNAWFAEICRRAGTEFGRDEVLDEKILGAVARQKIADEPMEVVRKTIVGLFTFWYQMTTRLNSVVTGAIAGAAWLFALIGWRRARQEGRSSWLLWLPILSMNVAIALLCSLGRYSMPIIPCLMILAAFGIDTLLRTRQPDRAAAV